MGGQLPKSHEYLGSELSVESSFISRGRKDEVIRPIERHDTRREKQLERMRGSEAAVGCAVQLKR